MKAIKTAAILAAIAACMTVSAPEAGAWGQKGHDVTCDIAQHHLTSKARKQINEIFDGMSMVYWANWMDNASNTPEYAYSKTWHYKNIDADETFENALENENGDVVRAINAQIAALKSGTLNKEAQAISLRMLIHLMGDLHCPMHMGHRSDLGGNRVQVQYFNVGKNLHGVWDSDLVESAHKWTHTEWREELDRVDKDTMKQITAGTVEDWAKETYGVCQSVYEMSPTGIKISYDYLREATPIIEQQFLRGGLRLASVLNDIFK